MSWLPAGCKDVDGRDKRGHDTSGRDERVDDTSGRDKRGHDTSGRDNRCHDTSGRDERGHDTLGACVNLFAAWYNVGAAPAAPACNFALMICRYLAAFGNNYFRFCIASRSRPPHTAAKYSRVSLPGIRSGEVQACEHSANLPRPLPYLC
jgi:hypothetical protein